MPPPSLSVAAICAQLGARLPVLFCPARRGESHTWGHRSETPTHKRMHALSFSVLISLTHKPTLKHLLLTGPLSPPALPLGLGGVSRDERHAAVATTVPSVLSCSLLFALFSSVSTTYRRKEVLGGALLP